LTVAFFLYICVQVIINLNNYHYENPDFTKFAQG